MKIVELVYPKFNTVNKKTPFDLPSLHDKRGGLHSKIDSPGFGSYAYGAPDKKDPHMFNKKNWVPAHKDGYYEYVRWIQPYIESNIFLPRVYQIKVTTDSNGKQIPKYKIEKLRPYTDFSIESILGLANSLFPHFERDVRPGSLADISFVWKKMIKEIDNMINGRDFTTDNDQLVQAIRIIQRIIDSGPYHNDMHSGNAMVRGTSTGPQLVITDPIS